MKKYDLCIPVIKSGCKYRKLALDYVKRYYSQYFNIVAPEIEEYNPSKARNLAVNTSTSDIVIVVDGDFLIDKGFIYESVEYVKKYDILVRPFGRLMWLNKSTSEHLYLSNYKPSFFNEINKSQLETPFISYAPGFSMVNEKYRNLMLKNPEYKRTVTWGAAYVLSKKLFIKLRGFDERIKKYGWEDIAFVRKIELMNIKTKILYSDAYHLYHTRSMNLDHNIIGPPVEIIKHEHYHDNLKILSETPYNLKVIYDDETKDVKYVELPKVLLFNSLF